MPTASDLLARCEQLTGIDEVPYGSNHNWVTEWWGLGNVAWCAEWVSVVFIKAGFGSWEAERIAVPGVWTRYPWGSAYVPDWEQAFRDAGRWVESDPRPGYVVIYDWDDDGWGDHIGFFVEDLGDGTFLAYEGNVDNTSKLKRRDFRDVRGYGVVPYTNPEEDDMFTDEHARQLQAVYDQMKAESDQTTGTPSLLESIAGVVNDIKAMVEPVYRVLVRFFAPFASTPSKDAEEGASTLAERLKARLGS